MNKNLIYGLYCPFTDNLHYIGKSTTCMTRPMQHMIESHSEKINEWVFQLKILGYKPIIKILEECTENNLDEKEKEWIKKSINEGCYLLNVAHNHTDNIINKKEYVFEDADIKIIGETIKKSRYHQNLRQEDLCKMAKISRPTLIMIEKGNKRTKFYTIKWVLDVLGYQIVIKKSNEK
jgi:DNA-binding XRE family transcriptional regulator